MFLQNSIEEYVFRIVYVTITLFNHYRDTF
jgi:hypothetical protein